MSRLRTLSRLLTVWAVVSSLLLLIFMTYTSSDNKEILGRYSPSYMGVLGVTAAGAVLSALGAWLFGSGRVSLPARLEHLRMRRAAWAVAAALLGMAAVWWWIFPGVLYIYVFNLFRLYVAISLLGAGGLLLWLTTSQDSGQLRAGVAALLLVGCLTGALLTLTFIDRTPSTLNFDEPLIADFALSCTEGQPRVNIWPSYSEVAQVQLTHPAILCLHGHVIRQFGMSVELGRLVGVGLVWLSAPLAFWLASVQFGLLPAAAAALVMVLFPLMHAYIRPEPFVAAALALALLAYTLALRTRRWGWHWLVGFALVLALEGNQMTVRFLPAFGLLYLWDAWRSRRERPRWWWEPRLAAFVGGLVVGAAAYYLFHVVYLAQTDLLGAVQMIQQRYVLEEAIGGNVRGVALWTLNAEGWLRGYLERHPVEFACLLAGASAALLRPRPYERRILGLFVLGTLLLFVVNPKPISPEFAYAYWVHHLPFVAVLFAGFVDRLASAKSLRPLAVYLLAALICLHTVNVLRYAQTTQNANQLIAIGYHTDQLLPPDVEVVYGDAFFFYGLHRREFYLSLMLQNFTLTELQERWNMRLPQALLVTKGYGDYPRVLEYIQAQGMVEVAQFQHNVYGRTTGLYVLPEFADRVPRLSSSP